MLAHFTKSRLEAFSDGVIAIIITIMVLEMKVPRGVTPEFSALLPILPVFLSYILSFVYVGIYWNNHHHLLHAARSISGGVLWANLHLLFWLSLIPFVTAWMGQNQFAAHPTALYGAVLLMCAIAYTILQSLIRRIHGNESTIARAIGKDTKGKISLGLYAAAIAISFFAPTLANAIYAIVAIMWFIPDRRIEKAIVNSEPSR